MTSEPATSGSTDAVINAVVDAVGAAVTNSNISKGFGIGYIRGTTGYSPINGITFHVSNSYPWREAFTEEGIATIEEEGYLDPRHGYIQSAFSSLIMQGSVHNMPGQRVPNDD